MVVWYIEGMVWYFEEGGVVLLTGWCGTLKRLVWYFEEGGVVLLDLFPLNYNHTVFPQLKIEAMIQWEHWMNMRCHWHVSL